jgi:hypothetical protein
MSQEDKAYCKTVTRPPTAKEYYEVLKKALMPEDKDQK